MTYMRFLTVARSEATIVAVIYYAADKTPFVHEEIVYAVKYP